MNTLGEVYNKLGNEQKGLSLLREGIRESKEQNNTRTFLSGLLSISQFYYEKILPDSAILYIKQALALAYKNGYAKQLYELSTLMAAAYHVKQKDDSAYYYLQQATTARNNMFSQEKINQLWFLEFNEQLQQQQIMAAEERLHNQLKVYALLFTVLVFLLIAFILYRNNRHKQKAYHLLQQQKTKTEEALEELKSTQAQLIQREKIASLGELTAGIAHEIQNPLNFVNNFSETNTELVEELEQEMNKGNLGEAKAIAHDIKENEQKINHHGKRADAIVKGMLQHSRSSKGEGQLTDINALVGEYVQLAYHGFRAKDKSFNAVIETHFDDSIQKATIVSQDIGRVLLNIFNNAFYTENEKKKKLNGTYEPTISVSTKKERDGITITVKDNGNGISQKIIDKIFQPFFTTKPTGQGTGLGLSLSYDIIKAHGGEITVESTEGEGTAFIIQLPI